MGMLTESGPPEAITRNTYEYEGYWCFDRNIMYEGIDVTGPPMYQDCFKTLEHAQCVERNAQARIDKSREREDCKIYDKEAIDVQKIKENFDTVKGVYDAV